MSVAADHEPVPASLQGALEAARSQLGQALRDKQPGGELLRNYSDRILELITPGAAQSVGRASRQFGRLAIVVIGGLARGEHCPHSDVDLVVVCTEAGDHDDAFAEWMRALAHPLWDAGFKLATTVHSPDGWLAGAAEDLRLCTALLDMRFVAGDRALVEELAEEAHKRFFGDQRATFLQRLMDEVEARQRRYGTTVYQVEPDLKFGAGGTRDISIFEWALMARRSRPAPWDPSDFIRSVRISGVPRRVARMLAQARDQVLRLRAALHLVAGRTQDRLNFQYQEGVPSALGVPIDESSERGLVDAIEACMQAHYRSARAVLRYGGRVFSRCQPPRVRVDVHQRIDERFHAVDGRLRHYGKRAFADTAVLGLEALVIARDRSLGLSGATFDAIVDATAAIPVGDERVAADPEAQERFLDLLTEPQEVSRPSSLELLQELGLLERLIPEFAPSCGRMQHEGLHVYTVDQHSIYAVEFLKAIARGEHHKDYTMATAIHLAIEDPRVLYLSTLLHDAGKPFGDQCEEGARIARVAAQRAGLSDSQAERCALLVAQHQTMPMLSQKRDLTDEHLLRSFAETVGDRPTLDELYLISLADMANVSPDYLTSWKLTLLDELYLRTAAVFASRGRRAKLTRRSRPDEPEGLPARYYSLFDRELRREHRVLLDRLRSGEEAVLVDVGVGSGAMRLTIATADRLGLLATLSDSLSDLDLKLVAADVFSVPFEPKIALDVFRVVPRGGGAGQLRDLEWATRIQAHLAHRLSAPLDDEWLEASLPPLPARRRGRRRKMSTKVRFSHDSTGSRTIVDVETPSHRRVITRICRAIAARGHDIEIARFNTQLGRVDAVFYVDRIDEEDEQVELARRIRGDLRTRGR